MAIYAGVVYTIEDETGKKSTFQIKFPQNVDIGVLQTFVVSTAAMVDDLITGRIVDAGISLGVALGGGLKQAALAGSDVEEGGYFGFETAGGAMTGFTLPTFDETFILATSDNIDVLDPTVDTFVQRIRAGQTAGLTNVSPSDNRGDDITELRTAREAFTSTRR